MAHATLQTLEFAQHKNTYEKIAALSDMPREGLVTEWVKIYKRPPPKGIKRGLLERAVAYRYQSRRFGKLKADTHGTLLAIAAGDGLQQSHKVSSLKPKLKSGTRLVREWHGKTHQVNVTDTGFFWDNKEYASLTAVARAITGAKWSGPRFFGL
jgi:hypothetical protein